VPLALSIALALSGWCMHGGTYVQHVFSAGTQISDSKQRLKSAHIQTPASCRNSHRSFICNFCASGLRESCKISSFMPCVLPIARFQTFCDTYIVFPHGSLRLLLFSRPLSARSCYLKIFPYLRMPLILLWESTMISYVSSLPNEHMPRFVWGSNERLFAPFHSFVSRVC
jgi:hypothetical protein